jgi:hypothetical protein
VSEQGELWKEPKPEPQQRPRDPIWDTLTAHFGEPRTKSERGRRNRAVGELREAEATVEEIQTVLDYCERNFVSFTEVACCGWLARALHEQQKAETPSNIVELFRKAQNG